MTSTPAEGPARTTWEVFRDGSPRVAITGIDVARSTVVAARQQDDRPIHWHVSLLPTGDAENPAMLSGDLSIAADGWFVGSTVTAPLRFAPDFENMPDFEDEDSLNALNRSLGPWAAHVLYDVAALVARQAVAGVTSCKIEIPLLTPEPHITRIRRKDDAAQTAK